jgi:hypothetical protein
MRSGTSITARLVEQAFGLQGFAGPANWAQKHRRVGERRLRRWQRTDTALLINIKDPYAWVVSTFTYNQKRKRGEDQYTPRKVRVTERPRKLRGRIQAYNAKYRNWLGLDLPKRVIRHEDVLISVDALYQPVSELLGVEPQSRPELPEYVTVIDGKPDPVYYTERHYLELLTPGQIRQISDQINWNLFKGMYVPT